MSLSIYIAIGAFFGAISRYSIGKMISSRVKSAFPFGTFTVNILGSFLLGFLLGAKTPASVSFIFGTGFMGSFTTFSTFKVENITLGQKKKYSTMLLYIGLTYIFGIMLAFLGYILGLNFA